MQSVMDFTPTLEKQKKSKLLSLEEFALSIFFCGDSLSEDSGTAFCPSCKKLVYAKKMYISDCTYLIRYCSYEKKFFTTFVEEGTETFNNGDIPIKVAPHLKMSKLPTRPITESDILNINDIQNILFLITHRCNENCKICYDKKWFPRTDMTKELIGRKAKLYKRKRLVLFGGEPTVREDILDLIQIIKKSGNYAALFTNGLKLADINFLRSVIKRGLDVLYFSFDGFREEIYEMLRGGREDLIFKMKAWSNLVQEYKNGNLGDLVVTISPTFVRGINDDQLEQILDFALKNEFISEIFTRSIYLPDGDDFGLRLTKENILSRDEIDQKICDLLGIEKIYFELFYQIRLEFIKFIKSRLKNVEIMFPKKHQLFLLRENEKFIPLFTVQELEELREYLEKRKIYKIMKKKKYLKLAFALIKSKFNPTEIEKTLAKMKIVRIAPVSQPIDFFLNSTQITGICYDPTGYICGMKYWS